jgi:hypothetical protein
MPETLIICCILEAIAQVSLAGMFFVFLLLYASKKA